MEVRKRNFRSLAVKTKRMYGSKTLYLLTVLYPTDCHCQCWRITLLTTIIVIPNEGQCEDHEWLKHRTFAMLLTRLLCYRRSSGNSDLDPILGPSYRVENSPSARRVDPVGSLVPVVFGHNVCLVSGSLS